MTQKESLEVIDFLKNDVNDIKGMKKLNNEMYSINLYSIESENKVKNKVLGECRDSVQEAITVVKSTIPIYKGINEMEKYKEKWQLRM